MIESPDGIRKAAILLDSLDEPTADVLLGQMPPELAVRVCGARADLGDVAAGEREQVLAEFLDAGLRPARVPPGQRADTDDEEPADAAAAASTLRLVPAPDRTREAVPATAPADDPAAALASGLAREDARTICLVLTHLPPARAADLLQRLPPERQAEVLQCLAQRELPPAEIRGDRGREARPLQLGPANETPFSAPVPADHRLDGHPLPLARPGEQRDGTMPGEAEPGEGPLLTDFDDLVRLEDAALARVFRAAEPQLVLLALSGANRELIERIVRHLPAAAGRTLRRQIATVGPTRLRDIELAQQQLAELAGQMCREGLIHVPSRRRFTMAA